MSWQDSIKTRIMVILGPWEGTQKVHYSTKNWQQADKFSL